MDERTKAAYAAITEILKQVITLATALLGFQLAFVKDLSASVAVGTISWAWYLLFASIVISTLVLLVLAGDLGRGKHSPAFEDIYIWYIRWPSFFGVVFFALGLYITMQAGLQEFHASKTEHPETTFNYPFYWAPYTALPSPAAAPQEPASSPGVRQSGHRPAGKHHKAQHD